MTVARPKLWSIDSPHLYSLDTELRSGGEIVDTYRTTFGIRCFDFDPAGGLFPQWRARISCTGVNLHHDLGALGAALDLDALVRRLNIMKRMGVNALRTSHNPPSPQMIQVCEELGIVVMEEAFDSWQHPKVAYDYGRFFDANSDADVTEMVSAAQELAGGGHVVHRQRDPRLHLGHRSDWPMAKRLIADVRAARSDPSGRDGLGQVPFGARKRARPQDQMLGMLDGLGLNYNTAASVDALHAQVPAPVPLRVGVLRRRPRPAGAYEEPGQLNSGENHTPGRRDDLLVRQQPGLAGR